MPPGILLLASCHANGRLSELLARVLREESHRVKGFLQTSKSLLEFPCLVAEESSEES